MGSTGARGGEERALLPRGKMALSALGDFLSVTHARREEIRQLRRCSHRITAKALFTSYHELLTHRQ